MSDPADLPVQGRIAVVAGERGRSDWNQKSVASGELAQHYGVLDVDGSQPDVWRYIDDTVDGIEPDPACHRCFRPVRGRTVGTGKVRQSAHRAEYRCLLELAFGKCWARRPAEEGASTAMVVRMNGFGRKAAALALTAAALTVGFGSVAGAVDGDDAPSEGASKITITQTPQDAVGPCAPNALGLTRDVFSDDDVFRLTVTAAADPCAPIAAKAAIYAMPANGDQWPQQLAEVKDFTISEAGVTVIEFAKDCDPVQFDVLTGATPQVISPLGEAHGPLLFPFDVSTSQQFPGQEGCNPTTTTTTSTTSTTTTSTPEVLGSTTIPGGPSSVAPTVEPQVLGQTTVPSSADNNAAVSPSSAVSPSKLALTGSSSTVGLVLGGVLLLVGIATLALSRRTASANS